MRVLLLALVTWAPLAVLSLMAGHLLGGSVKKPFLHDPEASARFLFVLPLLEFGALAWHHDQAFDAKWIKHRSAATEATLLGSADIQSLADIAVCYEHVDRMWPIPFNTKAFATLVLAALLPMIPLLGTEIPLTEIFMKLGELLV